MNSRKNREKNIPQEKWELLFSAAKKAQKRAYAPYSKFKVGAAILTSSGRIFSGCNVENASYGATVCAERNAVANAVVNGEREFLALCIVTDVDPPAPPCGLCLQVLVEFCRELPILLAHPRRKKSRLYTDLSLLLPSPFEGKELLIQPA